MPTSHRAEQVPPKLHGYAQMPVVGRAAGDVPVFAPHQPTSCPSHRTIFLYHNENEV